MVKELGSLRMQEEELEAQKQAAIEKVKELLNQQKQIAQMKTDLLQQGLTRSLLKPDTMDEAFEEEQDTKNVSIEHSASPRYTHDGSPVSYLQYFEVTKI